MSKQQLEQRLLQQKETGQKAFVPYIVAGNEGFDALKETILLLESYGVSAIELGIPFSDPVADGPIIQDASEQALQKGVTLDRILQFLDTFKERTVPIVLMTYINPIFVYGVERFAARCEQVGVSGVIIPDLPMEEEDLIADSLHQHHIAFIRLAALTSTPERLQEIARRSEGFLYAVSVAGTTGERAVHEERVHDYLTSLASYSDVPVFAGFGVSTPEQAHQLQASCDGVIVGSKIVHLLANKQYEEIRSFIQKSMQREIFAK